MDSDAGYRFPGARTVPKSVPRASQLGALLTMLSMLGFAGMDAMSKWLVRDYPIAQALWVRYGVFLLFALAIARAQRPRMGGWLPAARSARPWLQGGRSLLGLGENAVFVLAFLYLPLADTHAVAATSPLIVVALAVPLLGERMEPRRWLAVGGGFAGVLLIVRPGLQAVDWQLLLPLLGAVLWALYQVLTRMCARHDRPATTLLWTAAVGFVALCMIGPWQWHRPDQLGWLLLLGVAVLGTLSHYALIRALDFTEAGAVQPYSYSLLVWAALLGWLVFGDVPDGMTFVGAALVVTSGLYSWGLEQQKIG